MENANPVSSALQLPACDFSRRSVRVQRRRTNGFVEFEFSIGWPDLVVELAMPEMDFQEFCRAQRAQVL